MRIVQANAVYDRATATPAALLHSYRTLTEWSDAVARAGAEVSVVQRFHTAAAIEHNGLSYQFVADRHLPWLATGEAPKEFVDAIVSRSPDIVHVNGLIFPELVATIRDAVGPNTPIVAQHHGGEFPIRGGGVMGWWKQRQWRRGLAAADAFSFTAREQAEPWRAAGVIGDQRIIEIVEASTSMRTIERGRARTAVSATGSPIILWVGRLTTNKDPLTVLSGLELALPQLPAAQAIMIFGDGTLLPEVQERVSASSTLRSQVVLTGAVTYEEMPNFYGAADVLISGSHSEGSGYAVIEAMAAGVVPVVTDIPSFRAIAGDCGRRWAVGEARQCAGALLSVLESDLAGEQSRSRERFDRELSWDALGQRTVREYQALLK